VRWERDGLWATGIRSLELGAWSSEIACPCQGVATVIEIGNCDMLLAAFLPFLLFRLIPEKSLNNADADTCQ